MKQLSLSVFVKLTDRSSQNANNVIVVIVNHVESCVVLYTVDLTLL